MSSLDLYTHNNKLKKDSRIYYNLKLANIYNNRQQIRQFQAKDDCSIILEKQSNYRLAIQSFRLDISLPLFLMPIKEGFVPNLTISNISKSNPAIITTSSPHNLKVNDYIQIEEVEGMTSINGIYFVSEIISPTEITIKNSLNNNNNINSSIYNNYISGGLLNTVNDNRDLCDLGLCLSINGNDYPSNIYYIPDKKSANEPNGYFNKTKSPKDNNGIQDNTTNSYYFAYSFNVFVNMVNNALKNSIDNLNLAEGLSIEAPYIFLKDKLFSLIIPYSFVTNNIDLYFNTLLGDFISGLRFLFIGGNEKNFKSLKLIINNDNYVNSYVKPGETLPVPPADPLYLEYKQEYSSLYRFNEIVSIVLTSNFIRTRNEYYPRIGNPNSYTQTGKSSNDFNTGTSNILSIFDLLDDSNNITWREPLYYQPSIYKWIDLISDDPLNKIDCEAFFETKKGELLKVSMDVNTQSNIRFLFERI